MDPSFKSALNDATSKKRGWYEIYDALRSEVPEGEEDRWKGLIWAFGFHYSGPEAEEQRDREGSPFGAMFEIGGQRLPPRLADIEESEVELWGDAFDEVSTPAATARFGDLLWERRWSSRPDEYARAAARAHVQLASDPVWDVTEAAESLERGLEIARSLSDDALTAEVAESTVSRIHEELLVSEERPGIPYSLLTALSRLPADQRPDDFEALVEQTESRYGNDPFHADTAIDLLAAVRSKEDQLELRRRQVQLWMDAADGADGLVSVVHLERALDLARTFGLDEQADAIRVRLGNITEEDLDLSVVSADVSIPSEKVEEYLSHFTQDESWDRALKRFGVHGPPGGEPDEIDDQVREQKEASPLQFLVTRLVVDPDSGMTILAARDADTHHKVAAAHQRLSAARLWAVFAVEILDRLETKLGRPTRDELREVFQTTYIDESTADRIARAFELWWVGDDDESAHLLAPRLEAVIREVARQLGIPIIKEPQADKPGGVRGLRSILESLKGHLPSRGWEAYLTHLLSDQLGLNLRNVIGHGLRSQISRDDAALLLHAACFLMLLGPPVRVGNET